MSLFNGIRDWYGELLSSTNLWLFLNSRTYKLYRNVILPSRNGTAEIDNLIISKYGIFIIETKRRKGWIFGSEDQKNWTQVTYHYKYQFQNPLKQVYRQKKVAEHFFKVKAHQIETVVHFVGKCEFKTEMPSNVRKWGVVRYIRRHRDLMFSDEYVESLVDELDTFLTESMLTKRDHLESLSQRHTSSTKCHRCGGKLVLRTARKGPNKGSQFLGCSNYPRCSFSKSV